MRDETTGETPVADESSPGGGPDAPEWLRRVADEVRAAFPRPPTGSELVLIDVDPRHIHAFWTVSPAQADAARRQLGAEEPAAPMVLRVRELSPGGEAGAAFDVEVAGLQGQCYVDIWDEPRRYCGEIGLRSPGGGLVPLARANPVELPALGPAVDAPPRPAAVAPAPSAAMAPAAMAEPVAHPFPLPPGHAAEQPPPAPPEKPGEVARKPLAAPLVRAVLPGIPGNAAAGAAPEALRPSIDVGPGRATADPLPEPVRHPFPQPPEHPPEHRSEVEPASQRAVTAPEPALGAGQEPAASVPTPISADDAAAELPRSAEPTNAYLTPPAVDPFSSLPPTDASPPGVPQWQELPEPVSHPFPLPPMESGEFDPHALLGGFLPADTPLPSDAGEAAAPEHEGAEHASSGGPPAGEAPAGGESPAGGDSSPAESSLLPLENVLTLSSFALGREQVEFEINAELHIFGRVRPGTQLQLFGRKVSVRPDGTFSITRPLPSGALVLSSLLVNGSHEPAD